MEIANVKKAPTQPQTCAVCGETSTQVAVHYGKLLCNGCRAFFKRTVQGKMKVSKCKLRGECQVNPTTRKDCKACRYQACLRAGVDINKVQPARDTSTESTNRERRNDEDEAKLTQQRLQTIPPLFPDHFQYPSHQHNRHQHPAVPASTATPTSSSSSFNISKQGDAATPTVPINNFYPVHFFNPMLIQPNNQPQAHNHLNHHQPPHNLQYPTAFITNQPPSNNGFKPNTLPIPLNHSASSTATTLTTYSHQSHKDATTTHVDNNHPDNHRHFPATFSPYVFPLVNNLVNAPHNSSHQQNTDLHPTQAANIKELANYFHLQNQNTRPQTNDGFTPNNAVSLTQDLGKGIHTNQSCNHFVWQTNQSVAGAAHFSNLDFSHVTNINPLSSYDLSQRSIGNTFTNQSKSSISCQTANQNHRSFDLFSYLSVPRPGDNLSNPSRNSQNSSAFMIDTLLNQHTSNTHDNSPSTTTHDNKDTHPVSSSSTNNNQKQSKENGHGFVCIAKDIKTETETFSSSSHSPPSNGEPGLKYTLHTGQAPTHLPSSHFSNTMSPIPHNNGDCEDNDSIFIHARPEKAVSPTVGSTTELSHHACPGIERGRLTSTPNQKHPPCDSPEAELINVVDVINTPSPIGNTTNSDEDDEECVVPHKETSSVTRDDPTHNPDLILHTSGYTSLQHRSDSGNEATHSSHREEGESQNSLAERHNFHVLETNIKMTNEQNTSENINCQIDSSEDSGLGSNSHSYNKSSTAVSSSLSLSSKSTTSTSKSSDNVTNPDSLSEITNSGGQGSSDILSTTHQSHDDQVSEYPSSPSIKNDLRNHSNTDPDISVSGESRGSCPTILLKRSTPRKWKRFSSNENLPQAPSVNSPKRVKCFSSSISSPTESRLNAKPLSPEKTKGDEMCGVGESNKHNRCRKTLEEIKNYENTETDIEKDDGDVISTQSMMQTPDVETVADIKRLESSKNDRSCSRSEKKEDNCVLTNDVSKDNTSCVPSDNASMSSFLDLVIQRIRNAESEQEVKKAKEELERFYACPAYR